MSNYSTIILVQTILIFGWVFMIKWKRAKAPDFDVWLSKRMDAEPNLHLEQAFEEYMNTYNVRAVNESGEQTIISEARTKLQLIHEYNIEDVLQGDDSFRKYKTSLQSAVKYRLN